VVFLYYTNEMTMKEIGAILGVNESRVSQIHKTALNKDGDGARIHGHPFGLGVLEAQNRPAAFLTVTAIPCASCRHCRLPTGFLTPPQGAGVTAIFRTGA